MGFSLAHVDFAYQKRPVFNNLSLVMKPGRFYGLIGPNGCGKTTLLDLLCGLRQPDHGSIRFRGRDLRAFSKKELACQVALVPQDFFINFPFSAEEVVMMGRYPRLPRFAAPSAFDRKFVKRIMSDTDTVKFHDRMVTALSGGERQRVVFARALAQDTPVLVLDEATSNLDIAHSLAMLDLAARGVYDAGKTVIASFQDINLAAAFCSHLVLMQPGRIVAQGPTDKILTAERIERVFGVAAKVYFDAYANARQVVFKAPRHKIQEAEPSKEY